MYILYEKYKDNRDFLLHKWNMDFRFLEDKNNNIVIKVKNDLLINKIKNDYDNIKLILNTFFNKYIENINNN